MYHCFTLIATIKCKLILLISVLLFNPFCRKHNFAFYFLGDNLQTAVSVAKECSIIDPNDVTIEVNLINERDKPPELIYTVVHRRENLPNVS